MLYYTRRIIVRIKLSSKRDINEFLTLSPKDKYKQFACDTIIMKANIEILLD